MYQTEDLAPTLEISGSSPASKWDQNMPERTGEIKVIESTFYSEPDNSVLNQRPLSPQAEEFAQKMGRDVLFQILKRAADNPPENTKLPTPGIKFRHRPYLLSKRVI